jgi:hypothetical protein
MEVIASMRTLKELPGVHVTVYTHMHQLGLTAGLYLYFTLTHPTSQPCTLEAHARQAKTSTLDLNLMPLWVC